MVINTNVEAQRTAANLATSYAALSKSLSRLSSGSKIINPADDAAGLAVSSRMQSVSQRLEAAMTNISSAVSITQTQDGYMKVLSQAMIRMSELSLLAQDASKTDTDRALYDKEFQQLKDYVESTSGKDFNGVPLFGGQSMNITIGADGSGFNIPGIDMTDDVYRNSVSDNLWQLTAQAWKTSKAGFALETDAWKMNQDTWKMDVNSWQLGQDMWYNSASDVWSTADAGAGWTKYDEDSYIHIDGVNIKSAPATETNTGFGVAGAVDGSLGTSPAVSGVDAIGTDITGVTLETNRTNINPSGNTQPGAIVNSSTQTDISLDSTVQSGISIDDGTDIWTKTDHNYVNGTLVKLEGGFPGATPTLNETTGYYVKKLDQDTFELYTDSGLTTKVDVTSSSGTYSLVKDPHNLKKISHGYETIDTVKFVNDAPDGATVGTTYYVKRIDDNIFTLHASQADAQAAAGSDNPLILEPTLSTFSIEKISQTNVSLVNHAYETGDVVQFSGSAPGGSASATNYYVRKIDNNNFSLHPSATDATNNANVIKVDASLSTYLMSGPITDRLAKTGHGYQTGDKVQFDGALPATSPRVESGDIYFVRAIDADTFSLHPSAVDASTNALVLKVPASSTQFTLLGDRTWVSKPTHGMVTGDQVQFKTSAPTGTPATDTTSTYHVRKINEDAFSLHTNATGALTGADIIVFDEDASSYDLVQNTPTLNKTSHGFQTGHIVQFTGASSPADSTTYTNYHVRKLDSDNFTLHTSAYDAANGLNAQVLKDVGATTYDMINSGMLREVGHGYQSGDSFKYSGSAPLTNPPSDTATNYFIRVIDADHFSIHPTEYSSTVSGANPFTVSGNQSPPFGVVHNTATVTKTSHGYSTGNAVTFMTTAATSPNVSLNTSTNYFVRKLDDNNFTLHATSNDAASNANAITLDATAATFSLNRFGNTTAFSAGSFVTQNVLLNSTLSSAETTAYAADSYTSSDVFANGLTAEQAKAYATGSFVSTDPFGNGDFSEVQRTALNAGSFVTVNPIDSAEDANAKLYESGAKVSSAIDLTGFATSLGSVRLTDIENAKSALDLVNETVERITVDRASLGAILSRMQYTSDQITEHKMNLSAAISRISDVDIAEEATNYARQQILVQSGTQMLGQANDLPRTVLELLRR